MMTPRTIVVFRVDSGTRLGSGHVMRCLALAVELRRRGAQVLFVSRAHAGHISSRVEADGFEVVVLPVLAAAEDPMMLGAAQSRDAEETLEIITERSADWVVPDHYGIAAPWETTIRSRGVKVLAIDDLANRPHDCDALLDQNFFGAETEERYRSLVSKDCRTLLGPRFALLAPQYAVLRRELPPRGRVRARALVAFGGSDSSNETATALAALMQPQFSNLAVDIVIGPNHPAPEEIIEAAARRPLTTVHRNLPSLAGLMFRADFSIGAGGSTTWERLCLGLPSVVLSVADNQVGFTRSLAAAGYVHWLGSNATAADYAESLCRTGVGLDELPPLVDGLGARRTAEVICPSSTVDGEVRRARPDDEPLFFEWRNEAVTREQSFSDAPVAWSSHRQWFEAKLRNTATKMFVGEGRGVPIGQARLDFEGAEGVLSYSIDSMWRGRGWGRWLVSEVTRRAGHSGRILRAYVQPANTASRRIFARLGWVETASGDGRIEYRWSSSRTSEDGEISTANAERK